MEKIILTQESHDELKKELQDLIDNIRPKVIKQLQEAREQGDLSENADYDAAKEKQQEIEKRISEIQSTLENCVINDGRDIKGQVSLYNWVKYKDLSDNTSYCFQIVGSIESNPDEYKISNESPLAKALLGRKKGETVEVKGIDYHYKVTIEEISSKRM